jgi:hypothetical protein
LLPAEIRQYVHRVESASKRTVSLTNQLFEEHISDEGLGQLLFVTRYMGEAWLAERGRVEERFRQNEFSVGVSTLDLAARALRIRLYNEQTIIRVEAHPEHEAAQWHAHFERGRLLEFRPTHAWVRPSIPRRSAEYLLETVRVVEGALSDSTPPSAA